MKNTDMLVEQRNQNRFQVKSGAYAVLEYKPFKMGKIINISRNGLAVCYSSNGRPLKEIFELDIFIIDSNFYIEKIRVKILDDFELAHQHLFSSSIDRQRCFQFGKMKSSQLFYLDYFLENFTQ